MNTNEPLSVIVGRRLRALRNERGWSLTDVQRISGVHPAVTRSREVAARAITLDQLAEVAEFWEVTPEELISVSPMTSEMYVAGMLRRLADRLDAEDRAYEPLGEIA